MKFWKMKKMIGVYQNVLIEPKLYLVMIHLLISMSNLTFWDVANFCRFLLPNIYVKNGIFQKCFRQNAKGKMTAWDVRVSCFGQHLDFSIQFADKI